MSLLTPQTKDSSVPVPVRIFPDSDALGRQVADEIVHRLSTNGEEPFLLGCPSGRTAAPVYRALASLAARGADLSRLVIVMMDEYVMQGSDGGFMPVDPELSHSCLGFALRDIIAPIARAAAQAGVPAPSMVWTPDPADPDAYDARIAAAGGIDLFILATGASDGHIAFNQPGTRRASGTHVTPLGEATRRDNMGTFPDFTDISMVPTHGVTVGVGTIAALSREVVMIVNGAHKSHALDRISRATTYEPDWPATITAECAAARIYADEAAANGLTPGTSHIADRRIVPSHDTTEGN